MSPNIPSTPAFPLEFNLNSQQIQNYNSPNLQNGLNANNNTLNNSLNNNGLGTVFRTNSNSNVVNGGESMPPSPQSQHSCFNSPQGSPGPHAISPQDLNPFSNNNSNNNNNMINNYDTLQKKFDSFNLVN